MVSEISIALKLPPKAVPGTEGYQEAVANHCYCGCYFALSRKAREQCHLALQMPQGCSGTVEGTNRAPSFARVFGQARKSKGALENPVARSAD